MKTNYSISVEPGKGLVRVAVEGFFKREDVLEFMLALREAIFATRCPPGQHVVLMDMSQVALHTQDVVEAFNENVARGSLVPRRLAVVVSGSLARMQVRRMFPSVAMTFFDTAPEAERWLLAD